MNGPTHGPGPTPAIELEPADLARHADLLHGWMNQPHVAPWWGGDRSPEGVRAYLAGQLALPHLQPWVASADGTPFGYVETYVVADDGLARHYPAQAGDRGWHVLVGPPEAIGTGLARRLGRAVLARLFADPGTERVVCEPNARNVRMVRLCLRLGLLPLAVLQLPDKRALLLGCTRAEYEARFPEGLDRVTPDRVWDLLGVGLGPFNLGLAALADQIDGLESVFFDARPAFSWHEGVMVDGSQVQVPFLADLVTMADPTNPYSFLNYLHCRGRLYRFYFYEHFHIPRQEFDAYCRWVADSLASCRFGRRVESVTPSGADEWTVVVRGPDGEDEVHRARAVVFGVGTRPTVPPCARFSLGPRVFHSADYLTHRPTALASSSVAVVGSGQSAAEVFADLLDNLPADGARLDWFTRSRGFLPMEYSKLGLEHFSPEYGAWFHRLPETTRERVRSGQDLLYKGISADTSARIYDRLYERTIDRAETGVTYRSTCELRRIDVTGAGARLHLHHLDEDVRLTHDADVVVLATGYEPAPLPLDPALLERDGHGRPVVGDGYRLHLVDQEKPSLFVQNAELHTHGVGAPDLGLGAHRNAVILNAVCGREVLAVRSRNVFQTFGTEPA